MPRITRTRRGEENNTGVKAGDKQALGAGTPAHRHRPFPSIARTVPPGPAAPSLPERLCSPEPGSSSSPQVQFQLKDWWRRGTRQEPPARAQHASACAEVSAPGLEKPVSLPNWCFPAPKQGHSAGPDSHPVPIFPSAPFPPQGRASLHRNCSWLYTASASSQAELRELQACISSGNAEDWNRKKQRVRSKTGLRRAQILTQVRRD